MTARIGPRGRGARPALIPPGRQMSPFPPARSLRGIPDTRRNRWLNRSQLEVMCLPGAVREPGRGPRAHTRRAAGSRRGHTGHRPATRVGRTLEGDHNVGRSAMGLILGIDTRRNGDHTTVLASGELDMAPGRLLASLTPLRRSRDRELTLDLTELHFCDAAGLAALLTASRLAQVEQVDFEILSPGERLSVDHSGSRRPDPSRRVGSQSSTTTRQQLRGRSRRAAATSVDLLHRVARLRVRESLCSPNPRSAQTSNGPPLFEDLLCCLNSLRVPVRPTRLTAYVASDFEYPSASVRYHIKLLLREPLRFEAALRALYGPRLPVDADMVDGVRRLSL